MELVRGEPLSTLIARGPLDPEETLRIIEQAAWALQAAHERGFVHRDVKPGNILVRTDGKVKLTDFGIAKAADAVPVTRSGMVMGTAHYIAPEQASGAEAGPAGDVYSLGIVGLRVPGRAPAVPRRERRGGGDDAGARPAAAAARDRPDHARELIEAVLVKDPAQRYSTGGELAAAVAAVRRGGPCRYRASRCRAVAPPAVGDRRDRRDRVPAAPRRRSSGVIQVPAPSCRRSPPPACLRPVRPARSRSADRTRGPARCRTPPARRPRARVSGFPTRRRPGRRAGPARTPAVRLSPAVSSRSGSAAAVAARPDPHLELRPPWPRHHRAPAHPARPRARPRLLLVLFVLLTLAAVAVGVYLLRVG